MNTTPVVPVRRLIFVPAILTLFVTLVRLAGELMHWPETFFSRQGGGAGAIVGIVWLVPVFGAYFALALAREGQEPASKAKAVGLALLSLLVLPVTVFLVRSLGLSGVPMILVFGVASLVSLGVAYTGWPALGGVLLAYALAARIPVALLMLIAMAAGWGTHYEVGPPNLPEMGLLAKWLIIGLIPQLTLWIGFTVSVGMLVGLLFGWVAVAVGRRSRASLIQATSRTGDRS